MPDFPYPKNRDWVNKSEGWVAGDPTADATWFERTEAALHQGQDYEKLVPVNPAAAPTDGQALVWDPVNLWYTPGAVASGGAAAADYGLYMGNFLGGSVYENRTYHSYVFSPVAQDLTLDSVQLTALVPNMAHHFYVFEIVPGAPATNDLVGVNADSRFVTPSSVRPIHYQTFTPTTFRQDLALVPVIAFEQGKFYEIGLGNSGVSGVAISAYSNSFPPPRQDMVWVTPMAADNFGGRRLRRASGGEVLVANLGFNHSGVIPAGPMPTVDDPNYVPPPAARLGTYKFTDLGGTIGSNVNPSGYSFTPSVNITVTGADLYNTFSTSPFDFILGQGNRVAVGTAITELSRASGLVPDASGTIQAVFPAPVQLTAGVTYDFSIFAPTFANDVPGAGSGNVDPPEFAVTRAWGHAYGSQYTSVYIPSGLVYQVT